VKAQIADLDQQIAAQSSRLEEMTKTKREVLKTSKREILDPAETRKNKTKNKNENESEKSVITKMGKSKGKKSGLRGRSSRTVPIAAYFLRRKEMISRKSRVLPPPKILNPFFHDMLSFPEGSYFILSFSFFFFSFTHFVLFCFVLLFHSRILLSKASG
jgi:hypothetical protein